MPSKRYPLPYLMASERLKERRERHASDRECTSVHTCISPLWRHRTLRALLGEFGGFYEGTDDIVSNKCALQECHARHILTYETHYCVMQESHHQDCQTHNILALCCSMQPASPADTNARHAPTAIPNGKDTRAIAGTHGEP